jgi:hypothetical protein
MTIAEQQLTRIGFGIERSEPSCWRIQRLDGPLFSETATEPAESRGLMRWRVLLARGPRCAAYRISRIER